MHACLLSGVWLSVYSSCFPCFRHGFHGFRMKSPHRPLEPNAVTSAGHTGIAVDCHRISTEWLAGTLALASTLHLTQCNHLYIHATQQEHSTQPSNRPRATRLLVFVFVFSFFFYCYSVNNQISSSPSSLSSSFADIADVSAVNIEYR